MVASQERAEYVSVAVAAGWELSEAPHYQSATKLVFNVETNLLNYSFSTLPFINFTCNPARNSTSVLIPLLIIIIYQCG